MMPATINPMIFSHSLEEHKAINKALEYLPGDVLEKWRNSLYICTNDGRHGIRLDTDVRQKELIFLSERIWPMAGSEETDRFYRFFIFLVLHEIAHVELDDEDEDNANDKAKEWFNRHVDEINGSQQALKLEPFTCKERKEIKDLVDTRDWTFNSRRADPSGSICIQFRKEELEKVLTYFDERGTCAEVVIRGMVRKLLAEEGQPREVEDAEQ